MPLYGGIHKAVANLLLPIRNYSVSLNTSPYARKAKAVLARTSTEDLATAFENWDGCSEIVLAGSDVELIGDDVYYELVRRGCPPVI